MRHSSISALCAMLALSLAAPVVAQTPAAAPAAAPGPVAQGLGVISLDASIAGSNAYRQAQQQRQVTYKTTLDAAQARATQIDAGIKQLVDKFNADRAAKRPDTELQAEYGAIQAAQERGKAEIDQLLMPANLSEAYVIEQISEQLDKAVQQAMGKRNVTLLLNANTVVARTGAYDLTPSVVAELNALIPAAQLVPPQGWVPRQAREQQAARNAPAPAPAATKPKTDGR